MNNDEVEERQKLLLQLNGDRNAGKESFEDEIKRLGDAADVDLRKNNSNAKTGVCFLTKYRCQRIAEYLTVRREWKQCDEFSREKDF
jgi:hypothetical protein